MSVQIAIEDVQIGAANAARTDSDQNVVFARPGNRYRCKAQGLGPFSSIAVIVAVLTCFIFSTGCRSRAFPLSNSTPVDRIDSGK